MNNKIYKDGEYAQGKGCICCKTKVDVFYDKKSDFFFCNKCLVNYENNIRCNHARS